MHTTETINYNATQNAFIGFGWYACLVCWTSELMPDGRSVRHYFGSPEMVLLTKHVVFIRKLFFWVIRSNLGPTACPTLIRTTNKNNNFNKTEKPNI